MMKDRKIGFSAFLAIITALVALITLVSSTYAWITERNFSNETPLSGTVSEGDGDLLISNQQNGPFDVTCDLILNNASAQLLPMTTADLVNFYVVGAQNSSGIATVYIDAGAMKNNNTLSGTVYLKAQGNKFDIYLWKDSLSCGDDVQALAAMRLGLRIETQSGTSTHIFKLDDLANTSSAETRRTVAASGTVVSKIDGSGNPTYVTDPSVNLSDYFALGTADNITAGAKSLCTVANGETAQVQYWLYIEGCDDNSINSVQGKDIALQLGFAGA